MCTDKVEYSIFCDEKKIPNQAVSLLWLHKLPGILYVKLPFISCNLYLDCTQLYSSL